MDMEIFNLNYSLKNIPIPSPTIYKLKLIEKIESFLKRMRWKVHFLNQDLHNNNTPKKEKYGFKTKKCPPQQKELDDIYI